MDAREPAVSKAVAQLEQYLGVQLLLRSTRGLMPTEAGQAYYDGSLRAIDEANEAEAAAQVTSVSLSGKLKICAAVTFASLHIVPHLPSFLALHPKLTIDVVLDDRNIDLLEAGVDVALRMGVLGDSAMTARKVAQSRRVVLGTPAYLAAAGEPLHPGELPAHESIVYDRVWAGSAWSFRKDESEVSVAVSGRVRMSAAEGVRAAVLSDMGLAVVSAWMFTEELKSGAVREVLSDWSLAPIDLWAVYPSGRKASAKARAFVTFVEQTLAASR